MVGNSWMDGWFKWKLQTPKFFGNWIFHLNQPSIHEFQVEFFNSLDSFQGFFFIFGAQNFPHRKTWAKTNQVLEIPVPKKRPKIIKGNGEATINTIVGGWTTPSPKYARQMGEFPQVRVNKNKYLKPPNKSFACYKSQLKECNTYMNIHLHISKGQNHQPTSWFSSCGTVEPGKTSGRNKSVVWNMLEW